MNKEKIQLEYMLKSSSSNIIWSIISTPSGLETWFADRVQAQNKTFTFKWGKTEERKAEVIHIRTNKSIRFHWLDDENPKSYFEFKMIYNELTEDIVLEVTDWAYPDEKEDARDLWNSDIEKMKRISGL